MEPTNTLAQITADAILGAEGSVVTPGVDVGGQAADRIDGGATRGINLFHSFDQFNVEDEQRIYFANPAIACAGSRENYLTQDAIAQVTIVILMHPFADYGAKVGKSPISEGHNNIPKARIRRKYYSSCYSFTSDLALL